MQRLEHDPETCEAVFRKDHAQTTAQSAMTIHPKLVALLATDHFVASALPSEGDVEVCIGMAALGQRTSILWRNCRKWPFASFAPLSEVEMMKREPDDRFREAGRWARDAVDGADELMNPHYHFFPLFPHVALAQQPPVAVSLSCPQRIGGWCATTFSVRVRCCNIGGRRFRERG